MKYNNGRTKYKYENYKPFSKDTEFIYGVAKEGNVRILKNKKLRYVLKIRKNGYIPKTGILICDYLNKISMPSESLILDVGTGEGALLAIHAASLWKNKVIAIDIDKTTTKWATINVKINKLSKKVRVIKKSISSFRTTIRFDLIISNPPQMPVCKNKSMHDDGGFDGRECIMELIMFTRRSLKEGGSLIFNAFDFLGIDKSYNKKSSLADILKRYSFHVKIVGKIKKEIKPDSYTFRNLNHIKSIYPNYIFKKNKKGFYTYNVFVVHAKKLKNKEKD